MQDVLLSNYGSIIAQIVNLVMPTFTNLADAIRESVHDGDSVALEGFTHLIPSAAGLEIIRQGRRYLTLIRLTPDIIYDQMIGMGCARKLVFAWGGNPGVGSLYRLRDAVERGWPHPLELDERSHAGMSAAYSAGAAGLPMGILRGFVGSDLPKYNPNIRFIECPFTGDKLAATPAINPDVAVIHAQRADEKGNVQLWGIQGVQKETVLAAKKAVVTVEEVVPELNERPHSCVLPSWTVDFICEVPGGARPSYAHGYYKRDNRAYIEWDGISKSRETFIEWMKVKLDLRSKNAVPSEATRPGRFDGTGTVL
jgi:glutaconate CoA-transferase subunit A